MRIKLLRFYAFLDNNGFISEKHKTGSSCINAIKSFIKYQKEKYPIMKYRVGRKQKRVILDETGHEVARFVKGNEDLAQKVCDILNDWIL